MSEIYPRAPLPDWLQHLKKRYFGFWDVHKSISIFSLILFSLCLLDIFDMFWVNSVTDYDWDSSLSPGDDF